jgi:hypothetical protein
LEPALDRAIARAQVQRSLPVAQDLHFDMAPPRHEAFDIDRRVAERGLRFGAGHGQRGVKVLRAVDPAHALAATARHSLEQQGIAGLPHALGHGGGGFRLAARQHRQARSQRQGPRGQLVAHALQRGHRRADEDHPAAATARAKAAFSDRKP